MRLGFTIALLLFGVAAARSAEIRQFDHRKTEKLGNQLVAASKRADRGATTPEKKRAKQIAVAALEGKLFDELRYQYVVLDDPAGNGFLVYALAKARRKGSRHHWRSLPSASFCRWLSRGTNRSAFAANPPVCRPRPHARCDRGDAERG